MQDLDKHIEAILFSSDHPVPVADLVSSLNRALELELDPHVVINHLEALLQKYEEDFFPFKIVHTGGGYRFLTKEAYHPSVSSFLNIKSKRRLSTAAMETLAIIAYRQPISKAEIENIRGVNCDYSIQKLLERELIEITGRSESPGKPLLYSTSAGFMDYFGINSVDELPKLREFEEGGDSIGVPTEALEDEVRLGEAETQPGDADEQPGDTDLLPGDTDVLPGDTVAPSVDADDHPAEVPHLDEDTQLGEEDAAAMAQEEAAAVSGEGLSEASYDDAAEEAPDDTSDEASQETPDDESGEEAPEDEER